jgi:hypothetical protein
MSAKIFTTTLKAIIVFRENFERHFVSTLAVAHWGGGSLCCELHEFIGRKIAGNLVSCILFRPMLQEKYMVERSHAVLHELE